MKKKSFFIILIISLFILPLSAQQAFNKAFSQMKTAINKADYAALSELFSESIDLTVLETDGIYSKAQAKGVIKNFFQADKPKSFLIKHQGSSNDGTVYAIGLYVSTKGSYRVYALFKEKQGMAKIVQLQIEEEI